MAICFSRDMTTTVRMQQPAFLPFMLLNKNEIVNQIYHISYISTLILVDCLDIELNINGKLQNEANSLLQSVSTVRWDLGSCSSLNFAFGNTSYQYSALYTQRCCIEPGIHILTCYNIPVGKGWLDAYLLIEGHRHCDNFGGFKSMQSLTVPGISFVIHNCCFTYILYLIRIYIC